MFRNEYSDTLPGKAAAPARRTPRRTRKVYRKRKYYRKPNLTRFRASRRTYYRNRYTKSLMNSLSESKLLSLDSFTQAAPNETSPGSLSYKWNTVLGGGQPLTWTGFLDASLGGVSFAKGIDEDQRIGNYMFLKHTTLQYLIEMDSGVNDPFPTQFRMIIGKVRRSAIPAGEGTNPGAQLFLDTDGLAIGSNDPVFDSYSLMLQPLNKKYFSIMFDKTFVLQPPTTVQNAPTVPGTETFIQTASKYPFRKQMRITLPHRIKAHYENTTNHPNDYDYRYFIALYSHPLTGNVPAKQFTVTTRGTTSALDN